MINIFSSILLSAFAKLKKTAGSSVMSVCPSAWNNSVPSGWIWIKFDTEVFQKSVMKIQVSLKSDMNNGYFT